MLLNQNVTVVELENELDLYLKWLKNQDRLLISGVNHATIIGCNDTWWIFTYDLIDSNSFNPTFLSHQKLYSDNILLINPVHLGSDIKRLVCMYTYDWRYAHKFWNKMINNKFVNYKKVIYDNVDSWMSKIEDLNKNYSEKMKYVENFLSTSNEFEIYNRAAIIMSLLNNNDWPIDWGYNTVRPSSKLASKWKDILSKNDYIIDFRASHIYRLSNEINYKWNEYPYLSMAKKIFDKDEISEEEISAVKIEIFSILYGSDFEKSGNTGIEFLDLAKEYKKQISSKCDFEKDINKDNWWNMHINLLELKHVMNWIWERIDYFISGQISLKGYVFDSIVVNIPDENLYKQFMEGDLGSPELKIKRRK